MNAGDELRLRFPEAPPPARGLVRDFVVVGDGWVKDGDYNTTLLAHGAAAADAPDGPIRRAAARSSRTIRCTAGTRATSPSTIRAT